MPQPFVVSKELRPLVKTLQIDSDPRMAVGRATKRGSTYHFVKSDHYTCILTMTDLPRVREKNREQQIKWNLEKEGGWRRYEKLAEEFSEILEEMLNDKDTDIDIKIKKFETIHDKIRFKAFGKVRISEKKHTKENTDNENTAETNRTEEIYKEREREITEIKKMKMSKVGNILKIRKKILGGNKKEKTKQMQKLTLKLGNLWFQNII